MGMETLHLSFRNIYVPCLDRGKISEAIRHRMDSGPTAGCAVTLGSVGVLISLVLRDQMRQRLQIILALPYKNYYDHWIFLNYLYSNCEIIKIVLIYKLCMCLLVAPQQVLNAQKNNSALQKCVLDFARLWKFQKCVWYIKCDHNIIIWSLWNIQATPPYEVNKN